MTDIPEWLRVMRSITGTSEEPGSADNPKILAMRDEIARRFPDMKWYCDLYQHDETPWCGLAVAYCMAMADIRPVYQPKPAPDTDRFLWAEAWASDPSWGRTLDAPSPGCVVVLRTSSGHHVTLYESTSGDYYKCRGGNQSDSVNVSSYAISKVEALIWPRAGGMPPPADRRTLQFGDSGADVAEVQRILGIPADGDFGSVTEGAVKGFQAGWQLGVDGVVGPNTYDSLDTLDRKMKQGDSGLPEDQVLSIVALAERSDLADFIFPDRGVMPSGYTVGMALSYALAVNWLAQGDGAAKEMAKKNSGNADLDVLAWYAPELQKLGWHTNRNGIDTLRALWCLLIALGPRESSGRYSCGIDTSAGSSSQTADTCEAGLFQTSWNIHTASPQIDDLFEMYWDDPHGFLEDFAEGVNPGGSELQNWGTGDGASYQWLSKYAPAFHCMVTAIGMRLRRQHWGPINKKALSMEGAKVADDLLRQIEAIVDVA